MTKGCLELVDAIDLVTWLSYWCSEKPCLKTKKTWHALEESVVSTCMCTHTHTLACMFTFEHNHIYMCHSHAKT